MTSPLGILKGFTTGQDSYQLYVHACTDLGVPFRVIDFTGAHWIDEVRKSECDAFLVRPTPHYSAWKQMFDERLFHLVYGLQKLIYPSYQELLLYENKRHMAYFLQLHKFPHPATYVFYSLDEATQFINSARLPLVFKTHMGAAGSGVEIVRTKRHALRLARIAFRRGYYRRIRTTFRGLFKEPVLVPSLRYEPEFKTVIFQQYITDLRTEWRVIRIGHSYFAHQKLKKGDFHSGSSRVGWNEPPESLLRFVKKVCDAGHFLSMSADVFEDSAGNYHVNELQSVFGSYDHSQMYINGVPGRYVYHADGDSWGFERGYFCENGCCNLRVRHLCELLQYSTSS